MHISHQLHSNRGGDFFHWSEIRHLIQGSSLTKWRLLWRQQQHTDEIKHQRYYLWLNCPSLSWNLTKDLMVKWSQKKNYCCQNSRHNHTFSCLFAVFHRFFKNKLLMCAKVLRDELHVSPATPSEQCDRISGPFPPQRVPGAQLERRENQTGQGLENDRSHWPHVCNIYVACQAISWDYTSANTFVDPNIPRQSHSDWSIWLGIV